MSSTNRSGARMEEDTYLTPPWAARRLLEKLHLPDGRWVEPCAGEGAIVQVVDSLLGPREWDLVDVRDTSAILREIAPNATIVTGDYLHYPVDADVIITNPPFSLAQKIIEKALTEADWVVMLLRMNFLGSDTRANWLRNEMPDIYTLPDRPNFIASYKCKPRDKHDRGCGWALKTALTAPRIKICPVCGRGAQRSTSDSIEYGWFVWTPERGRSSGKTTILESTPEDERKAA